MNFMSLFNGMGCGYLAAEKAGVEVDTYYSSEIDLPAIKIQQLNRPKTIQIGDVTKVRAKDYPGVDIVIGGSPCQGFSFAGLQLNFNDPRSVLLFEFVRIVNEYKKENPDILFMLENVVMKKEYQDIISNLLGVQPILINSSLVSAQNRKRLYWTNIPGIEQPEDQNIFLKDIILEDVEPVVLHNLYGGFKEKQIRTFIDKSPTLRTSAGGGHVPSFVKKNWHLSEKALAYMDREVSGGRNHWDFAHHSDVRNPKSATVVANFFKGIPYNVFKDWDCIRHFHPIECERLQGVPDGYTSTASNTQAYKMLGNGWNVDTIAHIFKNIYYI